MIRYGDNNSQVKSIQEKLGITADGIFGKQTLNAVKNFQRLNNLAVDGIVGPKTLNVMFPPVDDLYDAIDYTDDEIQLILDFEVGGGEPYYNKFLKNPIYAGYESGCTIMIGVDLRFISQVDFRALPLSNEVKDRLHAFVGKSPSYVKANIHKVKDISIDWDIAYDYFKKVTLPKWEKNAISAFPGFTLLPSCVRIALISLVFNRGTSMSGDRRREMRYIRDCIIAKDYKGIADNIRNMTRLWINSSIENGMRRRRFAEAKMVERALFN